MDPIMVTHCIAIVKINSLLFSIPCIYTTSIKCSLYSCSCALASGLVNFLLVSVSTILVSLTYIVQCTSKLVAL